MMGWEARRSPSLVPHITRDHNLLASPPSRLGAAANTLGCACVGLRSCTWQRALAAASRGVGQGVALVAVPSTSARLAPTPLPPSTASLATRRCPWCSSVGGFCAGRPGPSARGLAVARKGGGGGWRELGATHTCCGPSHRHRRRNAASGYMNTRPRAWCPCRHRLQRHGPPNLDGPTSHTSASSEAIVVRVERARPSPPPSQVALAARPPQPALADAPPLRAQGDHTSKKPGGSTSKKPGEARRRDRHRGPCRGGHISWWAQQRLPPA